MDRQQSPTVGVKGGQVTYQSRDEGHPEMPEVIVQKATVHHVSEEGDGS